MTESFRQFKLLYPLTYEFISVCLVVSLISLWFGVYITHLLVLYLVWVLGKSIFIIGKIIRTKFNGVKAAITYYLKVLVVMILTISFHKTHIFFAQKEFREAVNSINKFKAESGRYPKNLSEAGLNKDPYFAVFSPTLKYIFIPKERSSIGSHICLIELPPFGQRCFNFLNQEESYID